MNKIAITFLLMTLLISCSFLQKETDDDVIARVEDRFLYESELTQKLPKLISSNDSALFVQQYMNNWATKQLLKNQATVNLPAKTLADFDALAEEYKLDLYVNTYLDMLISKQLDTVVLASETTKMYNEMHSNFKLNEDLLKFRYISVAKTFKDLKGIKQQFKRFETADKLALDSLSIQFHSFMLNDSLWVKKNQVIKRLPILNTSSNVQLLKKSNFIQLEDSIRVYLVHVNDYRKRNQQAPQEYVAKTLRQIILNKRKLALMKQLKIDIRNDAIQNKKFETYH